MSEDTVRLTYEAEANGRLDAFLLEELLKLEEFSGLTRSHLKGWIEAGQVSINGKPADKAGALIKPGAVIEFSRPRAETSTLEPYEFDIPILYEDSEIIVINKPSGISMHPGAGEKRKTVVNALISKLEAAGLDSVRPGVVHRLDKDTTGVVVIAKTAEAHADLAAQFATRTISRSYRAFVLTTPRSRREVNLKSEGKIDAPLGRHPNDRKKIAVVDSGKRSITNWKVIESTDYGKLLEVRLETGRTHQIRVHMNYIGSPVIGDLTYGDFSALPAALSAAARKFGRQALHAASLEITHPKSKKRVSFEAPLPKDFEALLAVFRARNKTNP